MLLCDFASLIRLSIRFRGRQLLPREKHLIASISLGRWRLDYSIGVEAGEAQADTETGRHGDAETRRGGDTETRRGGDPETRRCGDTERRRRGDGETRG